MRWILDRSSALESVRACGPYRRRVNVAALGSALLGGLAVGRLAAATASRFGQPLDARRRVGLIELSTAALSAAVVARFGVGWNTIPPLVAAVSLTTLSAIDWRCGRLPDAVSVPASAASLAAIAAASMAAGRPGAIVAAVAAALGYGAVLWVAHELRPSGLGFGDVKLAPLLGLHLGWTAGASGQAWTAVAGLVARALLLSCLIGLLTALVLARLRRQGLGLLPVPGRGSGPVPGRGSGPVPGGRLLDTVFPFGPALAAGTMIVVLYYGPPAG